MNSKGLQYVVGVISDTHGLLRSEAIDALRGSDLILHAGDIGSPEIIPALRRIAPVVAIRGNIDAAAGAWIAEFPATNVAEVAGQHFYMLHDLQQLDLNPAAAGFAAVVSGHSHKPRIHHDKGVLFFNPGSAGPRRFRLPISVGRMTIRDGEIHPEILELKVA